MSGNVEKADSTIKRVSSFAASFSEYVIKSTPRTAKLKMEMNTNKPTESMVRIDLKSPLHNLHNSLNVCIILKALTVRRSRIIRKAKI